MKHKKMWRRLYELLVLTLTVILVWTALFQLGFWLMPQRVTFGAVWSSYLEEPEDSLDLLILGSSRAYCDVIPARIYQQTGVTSFVNCGPSQTASLTYYYLRESLRTQSPKYVFVEASGLYYGVNEDHSKDNVCYMPPSVNRILAAAACEEDILELALYPLQEFHGRIYEKSQEKAPGWDGTMLCGYTPLEGGKPQKDRKIRNPDMQPGSENYLCNLAYFRRVAELCQSEGIACVFFLTPTMQDYTDAQTERMIADLQALPGAVTVEDWTDLIGEIGLDNQMDWYDGLHLNQRGAEKFTDYLASYLLSLGLKPTAGADAALWQQRVDYLNSRGT